MDLTARRPARCLDGESRERVSFAKASRGVDNLLDVLGVANSVINLFLNRPQEPLKESSAPCFYESFLSFLIRWLASHTVSERLGLFPRRLAVERKDIRRVER